MSKPMLAAPSEHASGVLQIGKFEHGRGIQKHTLVFWVGPPPTNSGILGIYKDLNITTITSCGHYYWVGAQPHL